MPLTEGHRPAGTITLLIIRHDERTGRYRSQSGILQHYTRMNQLPEVSRHLDAGKGPLGWRDLPEFGRAMLLAACASVSWVVHLATRTLLHSTAVPNLNCRDLGRLQTSAVNKSLLSAMQELHTAMESHLRLHFNNESSSDDSVLAIYPTPLRRRILTFL